MTVENPKPKQLLRPITTGTHSPMNQSEFLVITCNSLEAREKSRVHGAIGFASHWLKNLRESFKPITTRSNRNYVITFDSHLKTALLRGTLGYIRNRKTEGKKIIQNRKTAKKIDQNRNPSRNRFNGDKWGIQSKLHKHLFHQSISECHGLLETLRIN